MADPDSEVVINPRAGKKFRQRLRFQRPSGFAQSNGKAFDDEIAATITAFLAAGAGDAAHGRLGEAGEALGIATAVLIGAMIAAGTLRRKIGRSFHLLHATGAVLLTGVLASHTVVLFLGHGPPNSLWHLCGSGAFVFVVATALLGLARRKLGRRFVRVHACSALLAATLALLHRLLA